jgi:hypothetical protein
MSFIKKEINRKQFSNMPQSVKFKTKVASGGGNTAGIIIPPEKVEQLGQGKRVPVVVSLNGFSYRNTIAVMSGKFCVGISADIRQSTGLTVGDSVDVVLTVDEKPREVKIPDELKKILAKYPASKEFFDSLSYSSKLRFALQIETAKTPETLKKRIDLVTTAIRTKTKI